MSDYCSRCGEERPWVLGSLCSQCANGGGPAFPKPRDPYPNCDSETYPSQATGMSMRDWFAGQAMVGASGVAGPTSGYFKDRARKAYAMADAMLAERDRK